MKPFNLTILLTLLMSMVEMRVFAYDAEVDGIYYNLLGTEAEVTYQTTSYNSYSGNVVIPSSFEYKGTAYSVTSVGERAFYACKGLTSITIPNNVTTIGDNAFCGCCYVESLEIPSSVTNIGDYAFYNCWNLTTLTIPNANIGYMAFSQCFGLTHVTIGNGVMSIGEYAFQNCHNLKSVEISSGVTTIGIHTFEMCNNLESIVVDKNNPVYDSHDDCNAIIETATNTLVCGCKSTIIPNSVTSIGNYAFYCCSGLTSITIPNGVKTIGYYSFYRCKNVTSITIPASVTYIISSAFYGCSGLESIVVAEGNTVYDSRNDCNAIIYSSTNSLVLGCKNTIIPNNITGIGGYAFYECSGLTSITIPNSVTSIGDYAFSGCKGLTSVHSYIENPTSSTGANFDSSNYSNATLYVPYGTKDKYLATDGWKNFANIVEMSETAVKEFSASNTNEAKYYSLDGKQISQPQKGLNILKMSDGTTRKVVK